MKGKSGFGKASFGNGVPGPLQSLAWVLWPFPFLASSTQTLEGEAAGALLSSVQLRFWRRKGRGSAGRAGAGFPPDAGSLPPQVRKALRVPAPVAEYSDDPHHAADAEALHRGAGGQRVEH